MAIAALKPREGRQNLARRPTGGECSPPRPLPRRPCGPKPSGGGPAGEGEQKGVGGARPRAPRPGLSYSAPKGASAS